jgi:hypothetical protein
MGSACELECEAILSGDLGFMTPSVEREIVGSIGLVKRTLGKLIACVVVPKHPSPTMSRTSSAIDRRRQKK